MIALDAKSLLSELETIKLLLRLSREHNTAVIGAYASLSRASMVAAERWRARWAWTFGALMLVISLELWWRVIPWLISQ